MQHASKFQLIETTTYLFLSKKFLDKVYVWIQMKKPGRLRLVFSSSFFFFIHAFQETENCSCTIHSLFIQCSHTVHGTHSHFIQKKKIKNGSTTLFTHLKIILLQYFQFLVFNKINCIQTNPK